MSVLNPKIAGTNKTLWQMIWIQRRIWVLALPFVVFVIIFSYIPMWGVIIAFLKYIPGKNILDCEFVGLRYFRMLFFGPDFLMLMRNTLGYNIANMLLQTPLAITFALLLNEIRFKRYKRVVQTISYMPHFISWVIVASLINSLLSSDGGAVNELLVKSGVIDVPFPFLTNQTSFIFMALLVPLWKSIGWSSIIYLAAIASVNEELYQAASIDGANRFQRIWHITLPEILPTAIVLFILSTGSILDGFDFYFLLGNASNSQVSQVLELYTYKTGLVESQFSQATAVGLFKSFTGMILLIVANAASKRVSSFGLFS